MSTASAVLLNVGAVAGLWGVLWLIWDKYSNAPGWLLSLGIIALLAGAMMS